jgi:holo-[acyl-carrier protein] synthase
VFRQLPGFAARLDVNRQQFMEVIGHGIDIVDLQRFAGLLNESTGDFLSRCFTPAEQARAAEGNSSHQTESLAGKFAAKEAVAKALGSGFDGAIGPLNIEIASDTAGAPRVVLRDGAAELAAALGISSWRLSISHAGGVAIASAIALRN